MPSTARAQGQHVQTASRQYTKYRASAPAIVMEFRTGFKLVLLSGLCANKSDMYYYFCKAREALRAGDSRAIHALVAPAVRRLRLGARGGNEWEGAVSGDAEGAVSGDA